MDHFYSMETTTDSATGFLYFWIVGPLKEYSVSVGTTSSGDIERAQKEELKLSTEKPFAE